MAESNPNDGKPRGRWLIHTEDKIYIHRFVGDGYTGRSNEYLWENMTANSLPWVYPRLEDAQRVLAAWNAKNNQMHCPQCKSAMPPGPLVVAVCGVCGAKIEWCSAGYRWISLLGAV